MAVPPVPESFKHIPSIGAKQSGPEAQQPPQPFEFMGINYPEYFVKDVIQLVTVPGHGDFYTNAPVAIEPNLVGLVQCFTYDEKEKEVVEYRLLSFINVSGIASYLVKPPEWWADVLAKKAVLPS
jgi:hypothetical protein